jgi:hypothetical protein
MPRFVERRESTSPEVWGRHLIRRTLRLPIWSLGLPALRRHAWSGRWIPLPGLICCATSWHSRQRRSSVAQTGPKSSRLASAWVSYLSCVPRLRTKGQAEVGLLIKDPRGCPRPSPDSANETRCRAVVAEGVRLATKTPLEGKPRRSESPACLLWDGLLLLMAPLSSRASGCMQHPHEPREAKPCSSVARFHAEGTRSSKWQGEPTNSVGPLTTTTLLGLRRPSVQTTLLAA